ncbi:ABC transporter permease [Enterococcus sp. AZ196]|uniref:ABC transporter permease n=1 Tax=Enterococcus sp. AZ196 TaxID=2774659 RepID=UPI003D26D67B
MKGMIYQLKNIRRDKLCLLTFLLPIIFGFAVNRFSDVNFSTVGETSFGIVEGSLTKEMAEWLDKIGTVTIYKDRTALDKAVKDPATQLIGVTLEEDEIKTILSGDEWTLYKDLAAHLSQMYSESKNPAISTVTIRPASGDTEWIKSLLIVITMVTAMFMGCTFNAMSIIGEKEDGISQINKILPISKTEYLKQKIFIGFCGATVSTIITAFICIRGEVKNILPLFVLIVLSAFVAALLGLFIGQFSTNMMAGIAYIKIVMILFIAPPILFYLMTSEKSSFRTVSYLIPSSATFYGLTDLINGETKSMSIYVVVLFLHCLFGLALYLRISERKKDEEGTNL